MQSIMMALEIECPDEEVIMDLLDILDVDRDGTLSFAELEPLLINMI